jgi:hypothetical protein
MAELTQAEAEKLLEEHGGYNWLLDGRTFWSVTEVVEQLDEQGLSVSPDAVTRWIKELPHTQYFGGAVGWRASRSDLIQLFASRMSSTGKKRKQA